MASLWLYQAAAGATAFLITDALLPLWEWKGVDLAATFLNMSGSFLAGLAKGGARADNTVDVRTALSIFMGGFLSVWTSLAFTVQHAGHLARENGLLSGVVYLLGSVLAGTVVYVMAHHWGRRWRLSRKAVDWAKRGPLWYLSGVERRALVCAVTIVAWGGWMAGRPANRLGWGITMAIAGGMLGNWICSFDHVTGGRINWGDWYCNTLAFTGVALAGLYVARVEPGEQQGVLESAFFLALMGQFLGTLSGFADLSASAGDLVLVGDYEGAITNMVSHVATAGVALSVLLWADTSL